MGVCVVYNKYWECENIIKFVVVVFVVVFGVLL